MDCVDVADRVFWREGFVVVPQTTGTNRLYTPHVTRPMGLRWGISVSIDSWDASNRYWQCKYELQALSVDEGCVIQCPLSPQPGFDDITQKMAGLLDAEFRIPDRGGGSTDR
jgi:hypothetical protein